MMPKKGYKQTEEHKSKIGKYIGENNSNWKGDTVSYQGLHQWVRRHKPISEVCENCHKSKSRLDAANISGEYKRDINDFKWMCRKCHFKYDGILNLFKSPETQFKKGHKYYGGGWTKGKKREGYIPWNKGMPKEMQPMYGKKKPHTKETKLKMSIAKIGKKDSIETRNKKSIALKKAYLEGRR